jgi:Ca2+-binding EF-hand superfamily protein
LISIEDFETLLKASTLSTQHNGKGLDFEEFNGIFKDREPSFLVPLIDALTGTTVDIKKAPVAPTMPKPEGQRPASKFASSQPGADKAQKEELQEYIARYEEELRELRALKYTDQQEMELYIKSFNLLSDETKQISSTVLVQRAEQIFGFRCIRLTQRFHELVDLDGGGRLSVSEWVRTRERLAHASWNSRMEFAFSLYDLDGDGLISVEDAVEIRRELQRLADLKRCKIEELQAPLCAEMRWLYDFILEESWLNNFPGLELGAFRQMHPNPVIFKTLIEQLDDLGKKGALLRGTAPPPK